MHRFDRCQPLGQLGLRSGRQAVRSFLECERVAAQRQPTFEFQVHLRRGDFGDLVHRIFLAADLHQSLDHAAPNHGGLRLEGFVRFACADGDGLQRDQSLNFRNRFGGFIVEFREIDLSFAVDRLE